MRGPEYLIELQWKVLRKWRKCFKRLQEAELAVIITRAGKTNIPPATSVALKEKREKMFQNNLPTLSLYFWWLFFPSTNLSASTL